MKKFIKIFVVFFTLTGCNIYNYVTVKRNKNANFSAYTSYAWLPDIADSCAIQYNSVIRDNARTFFKQGLSRRGYVFEADSPDVLLQLVIVNRKLSRNIIYFPSNQMYFEPSGYSRGLDSQYYAHRDVYCYPMGYCTEKIDYIEGSISLNMIDRRKNELVWTGTARGDIYDTSSSNATIHPAVKAIMRRFPARS